MKRKKNYQPESVTDDAMTRRDIFYQSNTGEELWWIWVVVVAAHYHSRRRIEMLAIK